jgi:hypothetical protein
MAVHNLHENLLRALATGGCVLNDPGTGGTIDIYGKDRMVARGFGAGTYILPTLDDVYIGVSLKVVADAAQTWTNATPVTIATLAAGETGNFTFTGETGSEWSCVIEAATAVVEINTASDVPVVNSGAFYSGTDVEAALADLGLKLRPLTPESTTLATAGAGTITAAALIGGILNRTTVAADYADTTHTGTQIQTALGNSGSEVAWVFYSRNTVGFTQTVTGGTDVTVTGGVVPPYSVGVFLVVADGDNQATMTRIGTIRQAALPNVQLNTTSAASPVTPAAGILTGANEVFYQVTTDGAFGITTRTATELFGDLPNCHIGFKYLLTIINRGDNTITITAGTNVTIAENTIATLLTQTYLVEFTSATACTWTKVRTGTTPT